MGTRGGKSEARGGDEVPKETLGGNEDLPQREERESSDSSEILKEKLEIVDKVQQAVETIKEKLAPPPAPPVTEPKDTALDEDRLVARVTQRIREEQEEERQRPGAGGKNEQKAIEM